MKAPPCPITGRPATRLIQEVNSRFLTRLWRFVGGVELGHLLLPHPRIRLWESDCGLAFYDPMIEGDDALYPAFYRNTGAERWLFGDAGAGRAEFSAAAELIEPGQTVLDVGCGRGAFRQRIPQAEYLGLDPFAPADLDPEILREDAARHALAHAETYDVVCAFEVLEHVSDPLGLARTMTGMLKPGGLLIIGVPCWPSPVVEIPNFAANAPPHHLSWWSARALEALAAALGLEVISARELPPQPQHRMFHWMHRLSPIKATGPYFRSHWSWHLSLAIGFMLAVVVTPFIPLPRGARPLDCILAARKPG